MGDNNYPTHRQRENFFALQKMLVLRQKKAEEVEAAIEAANLGSATMSFDELVSLNSARAEAERAKSALDAL